MDDVRSLRRAVAKLAACNDPGLWQALGLKLAEELAVVEALSIDRKAAYRLDEAYRYQVLNIDAVIQSARLLKAMTDATTA